MKEGNKQNKDNNNRAMYVTTGRSMYVNNWSKYIWPVIANQNIFNSCLHSVSFDHITVHTPNFYSHFYAKW